LKGALGWISNAYTANPVIANRPFPRSENPGGHVVVVEPLLYFAFLFFNETVITKTQGLVIVIAKRKYKLSQVNV